MASRPRVQLIEIPEHEQRWAPANLVLLEPGRVILHPEARDTARALERAGVDVVPFDSSGLMQGGVNGPRAAPCSSTASRARRSWCAEPVSITVAVDVGARSPTWSPAPAMTS